MSLSDKLFGKRYKCNICGYESITRNNMRKHIQSKHPESLMTEGDIIQIKGKIYKRCDGKLVEVALCNSCGQYKDIKNVTTTIYFFRDSSRGMFTGVPGLDKAFAAYGKGKYAICADCAVKLSHKQMKK
jgi:hypothetical protein